MYKINLDTVEIKHTPKVDASSFHATGTVLVGLGNPSQQELEGPCILNHKGSNPSQRSVSEFVANGSTSLVAQWKACLGSGGLQRILVEDLSLDTCFGLSLFLARIHEQPMPNSEKLNRWIEYVSSWEQGFYPDKGARPSESLACLASLLGHSFLASHRVSEGLMTSCEFLWSLFERFDSPQDVIFDRHNKNYGRALARYAFETEQFRLAIQNGVRFQLMIPVCGGSELVLTDAIALEEIDDPTAVVKVLLRNDTEYAWTRRGFGLIAVYRPSERGTGNDITIAIDPDTHLSLNSLWTELEAQEDQQWGDERPRGGGVGRKLSSYVEKGIKPEVWPHEPWWDGRGGDESCSTLVGAPKSVTVRGKVEYGTRLTWAGNVLPTLWNAYSPIPKTLKAEVHTDTSDISVAFVEWDHLARREVIGTPTLTGWLATQSMGRQAPRSPLDLPRSETYETLPLPGGMAVIHRGGVTLFDEKTAINFDRDRLVNTAVLVRNSLISYKLFMKGGWIQKAFVTQTGLRTKSKFDMKAFRVWQESASEAKSKLLETMSSKLEKTETYDEAALRQALEKYWGLGDQRSQVLEMLDRVDKATEEIFAQLRERRDRVMNSVITGLGAGLLAKEVIEPFKSKYTMNLYEWQIELFMKDSDIGYLEKIAHQLANWELYSVLAFVGAFIVGVALYWFKGSKLSAE